MDIAFIAFTNYLTCFLYNARGNLLQVYIAMANQHIRKLNQTIRIAKSEKLDRLFKYLKNLNEDSFTGYIKINFSQGSITRVERFEEISRKLNRRKE
jgi:hypothetical protein